jgi:hypothetical protein
LAKLAQASGFLLPEMVLLSNEDSENQSLGLKPYRRSLHRQGGGISERLHDSVSAI